jgi:hypothetical protein
MRNQTPLRCWASASYDPKTGRSAPSSTGPVESVTIDGETIRPSAQFSDDAGVNGAPSFGTRDRACTQGKSKR